jgi:hypothetical protein
MKHPMLDAMAEFLNADGINYTVFLREYLASSDPVVPTEALVRRAVGDEVSIERVSAVSVHEVLAEVTWSLAYAGDDGAGPGRDNLQSEQFPKLLTGVIAEACRLADRSTKIEKFNFKSGHPAYPVFWDFAFLFTGDEQSVVLVGSSSD